jgi:hypothetical protein
MPPSSAAAGRSLDAQRDCFSTRAIEQGAGSDRCRPGLEPHSQFLAIDRLIACFVIFATLKRSSSQRECPEEEAVVPRVAQEMRMWFMSGRTSCRGEHRAAAGPATNTTSRPQWPRPPRPNGRLETSGGRRRAPAATSPACPSFGGTSLGFALGWPRVRRRILASQVHPTFEGSAIVPQVRATTRAPSLLGEQRFERCDRVDLATA